MTRSRIEVSNIRCERGDSKKDTHGGECLFAYHVLSVFRLLNPQSSSASLIASRIKCFIINPKMQVIINHIAIDNSIIPIPCVPIICSSDILQFPLVLVNMYVIIT